MQIKITSEQLDSLTSIIGIVADEHQWFSEPIFDDPEDNQRQLLGNVYSAGQGASTLDEFKSALILATGPTTINFEEL